jgi:hydroxyquinol 1,2-dioxygenase
VWQNGDNRLYAVQDPETPEDHLRGRFRTGEDGSYAFLAVRPVPYTIPDDGPVGRMLDATARHPWRPAHIHMMYLDSDAVFAVKRSLLREFVHRQPDDVECPDGVDGEWFSVENDIVLAPA